MLKDTYRLLVVVVFGVLMAWLPVSANAGKWSDFVMVSTANDVVVSHRQRMQKNGWFVGWKVENSSVDWVEPFAKTRRYLCADGNRKTEKEKTLGPIPQVMHEKGGFEIKGFVLVVKFAL